MYHLNQKMNPYPLNLNRHGLNHYYLNRYGLDLNLNPYYRNLNRHVLIWIWILIIWIWIVMSWSESEFLLSESESSCLDLNLNHYHLNLNLYGSHRKYKFISYCREISNNSPFKEWHLKMKHALFIRHFFFEYWVIFFVISPYIYIC